MEKRRLRQIGGEGFLEKGEGWGGGALPYYVEVFWSFLMMQHREKNLDVFIFPLLINMCYKKTAYVMIDIVITLTLLI